MHFPRSLSHKQAGVPLRGHCTPVSLSWCLVGLCSTPAREVKCRRAWPDCTVGGEGDGWVGVVAVVVCGVRERLLGGSDLMRNSCTRMEGSGLGRGRGEGGGGGEGCSRPHFAILLSSRPRLCRRPGGAGGSENALTRPCFGLPIRVRTDRGFQVRQVLTPTTSVSSPMMTDKTTTSFC